MRLFATPVVWFVYLLVAFGILMLTFGTLLVLYRSVAAAADGNWSATIHVVRQSGGFFGVPAYVTLPVSLIGAAYLALMHYKWGRQLVRKRRRR